PSLASTFQPWSRETSNDEVLPVVNPSPASSPVSTVALKDSTLLILSAISCATCPAVSAAFWLTATPTDATSAITPPPTIAVRLLLAKFHVFNNSVHRPLICHIAFKKN